MIFHGAFAGFYILKKDSNPFWHNFYELSYLKYSAYASEKSIFGFNRTKMECNDLYCHFRSPQKFLQSIEFEEDYGKCVWMLLANFLMFTIMAYGLIRYRLKSKWAIGGYYGKARVVIKTNEWDFFMNDKKSWQRLKNVQRIFVISLNFWMIFLKIG